MVSISSATNPIIQGKNYESIIVDVPRMSSTMPEQRNPYKKIF